MLIGYIKQYYNLRVKTYLNGTQPDSFSNNEEWLIQIPTTYI